jgi:hypothetical protein
MPRVDIARLGALLRFPGARLVPQNSERPTYYFRLAVIHSQFMESADDLFPPHFSRIEEWPGEREWRLRALYWK